MAAYVIASYDITDASGYAEYTPKVVPTLIAHGAEVLVADHHSKAAEGRPGKSTIVLKFESRDALHAWYGSPEYQAIIHHRTDNSEGVMVFAEGFVPPS